MYSSANEYTIPTADLYRTAVPYLNGLGITSVIDAMVDDDMELRCCGADCLRCTIGPRSNRWAYNDRGQFDEYAMIKTFKGSCHCGIRSFARGHAAEIGGNYVAIQLASLDSAIALRRRAKRRLGRGAGGNASPLAT